VNVEDARKRQAAEPGTDDLDWSLHTDPFVVRGRRRTLRSQLWNVIP
jgi:hypothetical protein